jgi:hypothetical protein
MDGNEGSEATSGEDDFGRVDLNLLTQGSVDCGFNIVHLILLKNNKFCVMDIDIQILL